MTSTRRSLTLAVCGVVILGLAGSAAAQPTPDATPASVRPTVGAVTTVMAVPATDMGYESLTVSWTVPNTYWTNCTDTNETPAAGQAECAVDGNETPLSGFMVYYSDSPFDSIQNAGVMSMASSGGSTSRTDGKAKQTLMDLESDTTYYVNVAATNARGTGVVSATPTSGKTNKAPVPEATTGVTVEPGDKMLTVSWDPTNPDAAVTRTNLLITKYYVQYRKSQTATATHGEWMPKEPMEVMGDMTTTMIEMLTNDVSYDVQVQAENNAGAKGGWSAQTPRSQGTPAAGTGTTPTPPTPTPPTPTPPTPTPPTPTPPTPTPTTPGAPEKVVIRTGTTSTTNSITFSWTTPGSGMSALVDYQLEYMVTGESTAFTNNIGVGTGTVQSQIVPPAGNPALKAGTTYMIRLRAQNKDQGYGPWSEYLIASTKAVPGREPSPKVSKMAPPMVEAGDKMLKVSWTEPASEKSITHYQVDYKTASAKKWMEKPINVTELNYTISGLINDTAYVVRVRAVDGADNIGAWSDNGSGTPTGMPMPTPALPLFGAFGLGAGLLAVGRARMRRQAQLRGRREQRQMTR